VVCPLGKCSDRASAAPGVKLVGPGNYPMYLPTVRGRKSGQPRTVPIVLMEQHGKRYLAATYGIVDWVRNLRVAREAILTRGRRAETVNARELSQGEAALFSWDILPDTMATLEVTGRMSGRTVLHRNNLSLTRLNLL
jgi:deazaflavin-dependent oxidoreductase (nitroreductase family)